jgi:hypothetical protein
VPHDLHTVKKKLDSTCDRGESVIYATEASVIKRDPAKDQPEDGQFVIVEIDGNMFVGHYETWGPAPAVLSYGGSYEPWSSVTAWAPAEWTDGDKEAKERNEIICDRDSFEYVAEIAKGECAAMKMERDKTAKALRDLLVMATNGVKSVHNMAMHNLVRDVLGDDA